MKKNLVLQSAFEEAAKREIENLPEEKKIVKSYSEKFTSQMALLMSPSGEDITEATVKKKKINFAALFAAVLMCVAFVFTVSALPLDETGMAKLFANFSIDPDRYENVDIEIKGAYTAGNGAEGRKEVVYKGDPITIRYVIETGTKSEEAEKALILMVNGVRQKFAVENAEGKKENLDEYIIGGKLGETESIEITFEPNIGKKGETLFFSLAAVSDPDNNHTPKCTTGYDWHNDFDYDDMCDDCGIDIKTLPRGTRAFVMNPEYGAHLIMEEDAPEQAAISGRVFGYREKPVIEKIVDMYNYQEPASDDPNDYYNEYDKLESINGFMYKDFDETLKYEEDGLTEGIYTVRNLNYTTKGEENEQFYLNFHGKEGEYRVSLYIDTKPQTVFEGADYMDIYLGKNMQIDVPVELNTAKLSKGKHTYYIVYKKIGENTFENGWQFTHQIGEGTITVE